MVVLVIVTILAVVAVPAFITYLQTNRLIGASQQLYDALQNARSEAIKRNVTMYVTFQTGSNWCYGLNPSATCNCASGTTCTLGNTAVTSSPLTLSTSGLTNNAITFEPNHGAANVSGTVTLTSSNGNAISVKVRLLGDLLICSANVSGYSACS